MPTNKLLSEILKLLPLAQYVGYTATPFANVFIDPERCTRTSFLSISS